MTTCPSMNLRQVSVLEKMKIENAQFCIISIGDLGRSGPSLLRSRFLGRHATGERWAGLGRSGPIGSHFRIFFISQKIKRTGPLAYFFSKIVHQKGLFEKVKKNSNFWCCLGILDIYGRAFLTIYPA